METTLQAWINSKIDELKSNQKYREVTFKRVSPIKLSRRTTSFLLFDPTNIPLDSLVCDIDRANLPDTFKAEEYIDGAQVTMEVLKPRKRNREREYFNVQLV